MENNGGKKERIAYRNYKKLYALNRNPNYLEEKDRLRENRVDVVINVFTLNIPKFFRTITKPFRKFGKFIGKKVFKISYRAEKEKAEMDSMFTENTRDTIGGYGMSSNAEEPRKSNVSTRPSLADRMSDARGKADELNKVIERETKQYGSSERNAL